MEQLPLNRHKRTDSNYYEETPSKPHWLMRKLFPDYKITKAYKPGKQALSDNQLLEARVSNLPVTTRQRYYRNLLATLGERGIQLRSVPRDGFCLYHALAHGGPENPQTIRQMIQETVIERRSYLMDEFGIAEVTLNEIVDNLTSGSWQDGNYSQILPAAIAMNTDILLIMPNSVTGNTQFELFSPDPAGGGSYSSFPEHLNLSSTIILVHDARDHYFATERSRFDEVYLSFLNGQSLAGFDVRLLIDDNAASEGHVCEVSVCEASLQNSSF